MKIKSSERIGQRFGRLTVLKVAICEGRRGIFLCRCDCGAQKEIYGGHIFRGKIKSCGCLHDEMAKTGPKHFTHGKTDSKVFRTWGSMIARCCNPDNASFANYGGRGIRVCDRWKSFENFLSDMGEPQGGQSIDRIDVNGDYCPENCRWTDWSTQARNKTNNCLVTFKGETKCLADWADELGFNYHLVHGRLRAKWPVEKAFLTPARQSRRAQSLLMESGVRL